MWKSTNQIWVGPSISTLTIQTKSRFVFIHSRHGISNLSSLSLKVAIFPYEWTVWTDLRFWSLCSDPLHVWLVIEMGVSSFSCMFCNTFASHFLLQWVLSIKCYCCGLLNVIDTCFVQGYWRTIRIVHAILCDNNWWVVVSLFYVYHQTTDSPWNHIEPTWGTPFSDHNSFLESYGLWWWQSLRMRRSAVSCEFEVCHFRHIVLCNDW